MYLEIKKAWWSNSKNSSGQALYGLEYQDGNRDVEWLANSVEEAAKAAQELGKENGVSAELIDFEAMAADRKARRERLAKRKQKPGKNAEEIAQQNLEFSESCVAIPTLGGIIADLPLSPEDEARFPAVVQLPVTRAVEKERRNWVVVVYNGCGVAMTELEAKVRGLTESNNWIPDLSGVQCVPVIGEIKMHLAGKSRG